MIDFHLPLRHATAQNSCVSFICAIVIHLSGAAPLSASDFEPIEARPGGSFGVYVFPAENAKATVLMFEGAGGVFERGGPGFVGESFEYFVKNGLNVMVMTPPNDAQQFSGGMPPKFREQRAHTHDIGAVLDRVAPKFGVPVWLLGISMGSKSLATFAEHRPDQADGYVFMSSTMRPPAGYKAVTDHDLSRVRGAVMAVAHKDDGCRGTPPEKAKDIVTAAVNARKSKVLLMSGGTDSGQNDCGINTYHVFSGIEDEVAREISRFIIQNSADQPRAHLSPARRRGAGGAAARRPASSGLTPEQIKELVSDKTLSFTAPSNGRQLKVYFAPDGGVQMVGDANPSRIIRKEWFVNQQGWLCRKVGRQNQNHCTMVRKTGKRELQLSNPQRGLSYIATIADGRALGR